MRTLIENQIKYPRTNLKTETMLCMFIYGGAWYRSLSINEKINHRYKLQNEN